jgi:hypothetical protein
MEGVLFDAPPSAHQRRPAGRDDFVSSNPHHHARNVAPGIIATHFSGMVSDNPELSKRLADMTAVGRAGLPDGVGSMIASLLSKDNRSVNVSKSREKVHLNGFSLAVSRVAVRESVREWIQKDSGRCLRLRGYNGPNLRWTICRHEVNRPHSQRKAK